MSRKRKEIRKAVVKALKGRTRAGDRVRANRSEVNWQQTLPHVNIYFRGEDVQETDQAPRLLKRVINMEVEIIDEGRDGDELSDKLDDLSEQVEAALSVDDSLQCTADDIVLQNIELEADSDGDKPTGSARLMFNVTYHEFSPRTVQQVLPDLKTVGTEWDVTVEVADRPTDTISIPTN